MSRGSLRQEGEEIWRGQSRDIGIGGETFSIIQTNALDAIRVGLYVGAVLWKIKLRPFGD
jgi:hypothetical protein